MRDIDIKKAELQELLQKIRTLFTPNKELAEYFGIEIDWIDRRAKLWKNDSFRVGLIGVTSSGKSTLVNALLEARILPDAVRPSSNCLVVCEWGEATEGLVQFKDPNRKPRLLRGNGIHASLASYADEKTNPHNAEGVEEIRVRSPRFRLGPGVALIDTPGLDAFGHDDHEKLTLEVLMPTVDVVLFLSTCKANSDEKIREYVCLARDQGKPVIIVQNMVDSVEGKLGANGLVVASRNQVLEQHLHRIKTVLKRAGVDAVSISQVSAIWALHGRLAESGIPELVAGIRAQLDALAPAIMEGRLKQLRRWLEDIVRREAATDDPVQLANRHRGDLEALKHMMTNMELRYRQLESALQGALYTASREASALRYEASTLGSSQVDNAYSIKSKAEKWLRASPDTLRKLNQRLIDEVRQDCERLNLRLDDIDLGWSPVSSSTSLSFETVERSRTRRVEQSGLWGALKRGVDVFDKGWGRDDVTDRWTEIKGLERFCSTLTEVTQREEAQVENFVQRMEQRIQIIRTQFVDNIQCQQKAIQTKMQFIAGMAQRKAVIQQLSRLSVNDVNQNKVGLLPTEINNFRIEEKLYEIEIDPAVISLINLSNQIARRRFLQLRNSVLDNLYESLSQNTRVLILGFDRNTLDDFVQRFWFDLIESDGKDWTGYTAFQVGKEGISEIGLACLTGPNDASLNAVKCFMSRPCVKFVLVDIQQIGATENLLHRCGVPLGKGSGPSVLVAQSIRELENSGTVAEALNELRKIIERNFWRPAGLVVNDEALFHSTLANKLLGPSAGLRTIVDETEVMASIPPTNRAAAIEILRNWKSLTA